MNEERLDISSQMRALTDALGLPYEDTAWIQFTPGDVTALVFKTNDEGSKYVDKNTGEPASYELRFKVRT